jgi:histidinol dehydrogenase
VTAQEEAGARAGEYVSSGLAWDLAGDDAKSAVPLATGSGGTTTTRSTSRRATSRSRCATPDASTTWTTRRAPACSTAARRATRRVRARTAAIVERVRTEGDAALVAMALEFDRATLDAIEVPREVWRAALSALEPGLRRTMERAVGQHHHGPQAFLPKAVRWRPSRA